MTDAEPKLSTLERVISKLLHPRDSTTPAILADTIRQQYPRAPHHSNEDIDAACRVLEKHRMCRVLPGPRYIKREV